MATPEFRAMESRFVGDTGTTTRTHEVQDILRDVDKGDDAIAKVLNAPVAKQLGEVSKMSTRFLFDGMQRYLKVTTYGKNMIK